VLFVFAYAELTAHCVNQLCFRQHALVK